METNLDLIITTWVQKMNFNFNLELRLQINAALIRKIDFYKLLVCIDLYKSK